MRFRVYVLGAFETLWFRCVSGFMVQVRFRVYGAGAFQGFMVQMYVWSSTSAAFQGLWCLQVLWFHKPLNSPCQPLNVQNTRALLGSSVEGVPRS